MVSLARFYIKVNKIGGFLILDGLPRVTVVLLRFFGILSFTLRSAPGTGREIGPG